MADLGGVRRHAGNTLNRVSLWYDGDIVRIEYIIIIINFDICLAMRLVLVVVSCK
jgi:hypothetical protein